MAARTILGIWSAVLAAAAAAKRRSLPPADRPLGLASDLGGSIRQPAHVCGIHGLLPTVGRLPNNGKRPNLLGLESIGLQCGPIARSVDDLHLAMRVLISADDDRYDPRVAPVPLGNPANVAIEGLRVGFWTDDGFFAGLAGDSPRNP